MLIVFNKFELLVQLNVFVTRLLMMIVASVASRPKKAD